MNDCAYYDSTTRAPTMNDCANKRVRAPWLDAKPPPLRINESESMYRMRLYSVKPNDRRRVRLTSYLPRVYTHTHTHTHSISNNGKGNENKRQWDSGCTLKV